MLELQRDSSLFIQIRDGKKFVRNTFPFSCTTPRKEVLTLLPLKAFCFTHIRKKFFPSDVFLELSRIRATNLAKSFRTWIAKLFMGANYNHRPHPKSETNSKSFFHDLLRLGFDRTRRQRTQQVFTACARFWCGLMAARIYCTFVASTNSTFTTRLSWSPAKTRFYNGTKVSPTPLAIMEQRTSIRNNFTISLIDWVHCEGPL